MTILVLPSTCPEPQRHADFYRLSESRLLLIPAVRDEEERERKAKGLCLYCPGRVAS